MRTITIQADKPLDAIMEQWLAHLVMAIPVGPDGIKFDGDLSNGTIVNQRTKGRWTVSFRPSPDGSRRRAYSNPYVVARVIIDREHKTVADLPARDVTAAALRGTRMRPPARRTILSRGCRSCEVLQSGQRVHDGGQDASSHDSGRLGTQRRWPTGSQASRFRWIDKRLGRRPSRWQLDTLFYIPVGTGPTWARSRGT